MKKRILLKRIALMNFLLVFLPFFALTQVAINTEGSAADNAAMLDVSSTSKGVLIPRMTLTQRNAIISPVAGLMIYQTDNTPGYYFHDGSGWKLIGSEAFSIDDLSDGKTGGNSVFLGTGAGIQDDGTNNYNSALGVDALHINTSGTYNTACGSSALLNNTTGNYNTGLGVGSLLTNSTGYENTATGTSSLAGNTSGYANTAFGVNALYTNTTGYYNVALGYYTSKSNGGGIFNTSIGAGAGYYNASGSNNTVVGTFADYYNTSGSNNTLIGCYAGGNNSSHSNTGNVFLGYQAGYNETGSNKLYIENSSTTSPLVYGEFDNNLLRINGILEISIDASSPAGAIKFFEQPMYGTNYTKISANAQSANITYYWPNIAGTDGQILQTNATGQLSWVDEGGATQINDLSDAKVTGNSIFLGSGSGVSDDGTTNYNAALGIDALHGNTSGTLNSAIGYQSLYTNTSGGSNVAMGSYAMFGNTSGSYNVAFGNATLYTNSTGYNNTATGTNALYYNTTGYNNTANGYLAANSNTIGHDNVAIGLNANQYNLEGSYNTIIGSYAGSGVSGHNKSGNIFLGNQAGFNETGSNKLYIENSNTTAPLIYGEFDNNIVTIYGNLGMATTSFGNGSRTIALSNGVVPNSSIADGVLLYTEDVTSSSELKVRDEAGNVTTLSPHNFSMTSKSEPMAWSYFSENHAVGEKINVDMLRAIRLLEEMTGEKLVVIEKIDGQTVEASLVEQSLGIIQQQQKLIEELLQRVEKLEKEK
ncbi:MAG: hypothetical protein K9G61_00390 [Bacteroidales bacterium]|nr:hypothetical protein [Bacteroidales bacterium]